MKKIVLFLVVGLGLLMMGCTPAASQVESSRSVEAKSACAKYRVLIEGLKKANSQGKEAISVWFSVEENAIAVASFP